MLVISSSCPALSNVDRIFKKAPYWSSISDLYHVLCCKSVILNTNDAERAWIIVRLRELQFGSGHPRPPEYEFPDHFEHFFNNIGPANH
jgi:hypothetical protein